YASGEAKDVLGADSEPPVKCVEIGREKIGEETVLYRHEKTFVHQTLFAVNVNDDDPDYEKNLEQISEYTLIRVGETLKLAAAAITAKSGGSARFVEVAAKASSLGLPLILRSHDEAAVKEAVKGANGVRGVIACVTADNADAMRKIAQEGGFSLAVTGDGIDQVTALTEKLKADGFSDLLLQFRTDSLAEQFQTNAIARIAAVKKGVKTLGYPTIRFIDTGNYLEDTRQAVTEINKYGGIAVLPNFDPALLAPLMTLRLNIYTDPQKPIQVEPKVYPINEPGRNSAVFVTTNFSLTYFLVSGELEGTGINAWLVIPECEGMSVLTAWAAGKFSGAHIAKFIKEVGLEEMVDTREIVIPGYVAQISGELEESLPGWKAIVGPQESSDIAGHIKSVMAKYL
ncbi:MAG: acetyl-CoA decarbonylase/synthase complex subunit gamma, partial [Oscillospiraceae bacterium]|nr:acetyl-CoA decarbonylase/synthase complex subunit gamma [Oscillospiraceae bacterium]